MLKHIKIFSPLRQVKTLKEHLGIYAYHVSLVLIHVSPIHCVLEKRNTIRLSKVKRNQNGAFSIGKVWALDDIKQIQIVDVKNQKQLQSY